MVDLLNQEMNELQEGLKQKKIEEIGQDIADICSDMALNCCGSTPCYACIAKRLEEKCYRKIPENAVVLTDKKDIQQFEWSKLVDKMGVIEFGEKVRKETAEKCAERLKDLEEALIDMVVQFCQMGEEGKLKHAFMSAEEQAFDILDIKYGEKVDKVYKRFHKKWSKPIDEIAKEITEGKV